jgi:uncharacterized protein (DUF2062 family)
MPGIEVEIFDENFKRLPHDGETVGEILVRGPWICSEYYNDPQPEKFHDGWLITGDVGKIDPEEYLIISDRSKDLVKSGGEWISSVDLENHIVACDGVAQACVVAQPHPKWDERPVALVVPKPGAEVEQGGDPRALRQDVRQVAAARRRAVRRQHPLTSTGKMDKKVVRADLEKQGLPAARSARLKPGGRGPCVLMARVRPAGPERTRRVARAGPCPHHAGSILTADPMAWLRSRLSQWTRRERRRMRRWLERHPRTAHLLERAGSLHVDEFALARGVAVGVFVGLTPTLGVQTLLILGASLTLRANFPAALVASFVNNPLTVAPLYYGMNRLGQRLLDVLPGTGGVPLDLDEEIAEEIVDEAAALVVGSLAVAVPAAVASATIFSSWSGAVSTCICRSPVDTDETTDPRL